jgi:hypothetical protein
MRTDRHVTVLGASVSAFFVWEIQTSFILPYLQVNNLYSVTTVIV